MQQRSQNAQRHWELDWLFRDISNEARVLRLHYHPQPTNNNQLLDDSCCQGMEWNFEIGCFLWLRTILGDWLLWEPWAIDILQSCGNECFTHKGQSVWHITASSSDLLLRSISFHLVISLHLKLASWFLLVTFPGNYKCKSVVEWITAPTAAAGLRLL